MKITKLVMALAVTVCFVGVSNAQISASHDVIIVVPEYNLFTVSAADISLTLGTPTVAGGPMQDATGAGTFAVTTNAASAQKITAVLSNPYSAGISLSAELSGVGTSAGAVVLSNITQDVMTAVQNVADSGTISYTASATASATPNAPGETRTVTYTLTN